MEAVLGGNAGGLGGRGEGWEAVRESRETRRQVGALKWPRERAGRHEAGLGG